ncbi:putative secreted protein [Rhodothalassium salexigens DSM 2132]|uniref:Putative secreted protein n=1 Tax=Rhodothalassium salexigens DSM 2132 TaxID=1188247 RepID=A0A4R2PW23_RHOSA|nr:DUF1467 family protein [Rhodothalassium salexigens]MBB4210187.1 putative secreted protein [Rhodothalassium salexigens DSM 2132]MBK1638549.1 hypothetical protein [Rhodothalassium salexigens DSM 2132]TCP38351.1 putative secreted protein [Rhodothalassium salexigens DSM 2132]
MIASGIVVFTVVWWVAFFAALPFGVTARHEDDNVTPVAGAEPGAPVRPHLLPKALVATLVAAVVTALYLTGLAQGWFSLRGVFA